MQRLLARVTTGRASPRDLQLRRPHAGRAAEGQGQAHRPHQRAAHSNSKRGSISAPTSAGRSEQALVDDCPLVARDGGFIRSGYRAELDELRELMAGGKQWMAEYQAAECQRTGIPNIKVGFNSVFGYYLEVTHAHRDKVPTEYIRKQTIKNAERYITPELKEYEEKVLAAEERAKELELDLFAQLRELVAAAAGATASHGRRPGGDRRAGQLRRAGPLARLRAADHRRRTAARRRSRPPSRARRHGAGGDVCAEWSQCASGGEVGNGGMTE